MGTTCSTAAEGGARRPGTMDVIVSVKRASVQTGQFIASVSADPSLSVADLKAQVAVQARRRFGGEAVLSELSFDGVPPAPHRRLGALIAAPAARARHRIEADLHLADAPKGGLPAGRPVLRNNASCESVDSIVAAAGARLLRARLRNNRDSTAGSDADEEASGDSPGGSPGDAPSPARDCGSLRVVAQVVGGQACPIDVPARAPLRRLRGLIARATGVPVDVQGLICRGTLCARRDWVAALTEEARCARQDWPLRATT